MGNLQGGKLNKALLVLATSVSILLTGCGGGGGSSSASSGGSNTGNIAVTGQITVTPAMGAFADGSTVTVYNSQGVLCSSGKIASGSVTITIDTGTCTAPLIVQAGIAGDKYYDEQTQTMVAITGNGIRAIVPSLTGYSSVGVTSITEIAAAQLVNSKGVLNSNATPALISATNATIANLLSNSNVTDPLAVPQAAGSISKPATNTYGAILAQLAFLVTGQTAQAITISLAADLGDGIWDGVAPTSTGVTVFTPTAASYGASMAVAENNASAEVSSSLAPQIPFTAAYLPGNNIATIISATEANSGSVPADPVNTAKNLFTSLRSYMNLLANPAQTGFLDTQISAANTYLVNSAAPSIGQIEAKVDLIRQADALLQDIRTNSSSLGTLLAQYPDNVSSCGTPPLTSCQHLDTNTGGTTFWSVRHSNNVQGGGNSYCTITVVSGQIGGGVVGQSDPWAGTPISCSAQIEPWVFASNGDYTYFMFNINLTSQPFTIGAGEIRPYTFTTSSDAYLVSSSSTTQALGPVITGGTASLGYVLNGQPSSITVSGDLAASGATRNHDSVALNFLRTWPGATPTGFQTGFALANYAVNGSIASFILSSDTTPFAEISLLSGSSFNIMEDQYGRAPTLKGGSASIKAAQSLGESGHLILSARTSGTQVDGTLDASNFACDSSPSASVCAPTTVSFTGSLTNLADSTVGKFATLSITDTLDFSKYDATIPSSNTNSPKMTAAISGTISNNTTAPASNYQFSLNATTTNANPNQANIGLIYTDPRLTVTATSVLDITPNTTPTNTITLSSGSVVVVMSAPSNGTPTGNIYNGSVAPANLIGSIISISGVPQADFKDGTFVSLQ